MKTKIVTSGHKFIDIDAFACVFAYKELLELKGAKVEAVIKAELNSSITRRYKNLDFYKTDIIEDKNNEFIVMDVSDYNHFEGFVDLDKVSHIFDHHTGFERFWNDKIGANAIIKPIGAAATLIYKEYLKEDLINRISPLAAELLAVAILSNTLNFQAKITKNEDHNAYSNLKKFFNYTSKFEDEYFSEVQNSIEKDLFNSLKNDSKYINPELFIAQLETWDSGNLMLNFSKDIKSFLQNADSEVSFLNLIELGKKRNTLIFNNENSLKYIQNKFPEFDYDLKGNTARTPHVILRKEIVALLGSNKQQT